jgi:hypothetical protein
MPSPGFEHDNDTELQHAQTGAHITDTVHTMERRGHGMSHPMFEPSGQQWMIMEATAPHNVASDQLNSETDEQRMSALLPDLEFGEMYLT